MGNQSGYKKYMKKEAQKDNSLVKIFIISFFGMLLVFTFLIKSFSPAVDTSIGDYRQEGITSSDEVVKVVDGRLSAIQNEDRERDFSELMAQQYETKKQTYAVNSEVVQPKDADAAADTANLPAVQDSVYKVFVGTYTSAEQAKVAKEIIQESGSGLNPIVKCIGSNSYTLQVGIFKNKQSAESLLYTVQQNHLPGRIVQDY